MEALPSINGQKKSIPVLNVDASEIPTSALWRALEYQKQCQEEDEKWLEEVEQHMVDIIFIYSSSNQTFQIPQSSSSKVSPVEDLVTSPKSSKPPPALPRDVELDRASDGIHQAVLRVVQAVTLLTKTYCKEMTNNEFVEKIL